ncbi:MAG TPA: SCO family protein [Terracidiphilus sp.]|jgi:protein SCO1/2|nr:SCO family protein [Terracidiphilus sp.]
MQYRNTIRKTLRTAALGAAAAIVCASMLTAQVSSYGDKEAGPANQKSSLLNKVGIAQHLNYQLPLNLTFTDDAGKQVQLASYFGQKPAILALVYYQCPMLCSEELNGLVSALLMVDEKPGRDFSIIVVSIDPSEGTDLAAAKKRSYVKRYGDPATVNGWHFLTGTQANIDALTDVVGFKYVKIPGPDGKLTQFAHASSIQLVTPEGKLAQYYMGVEYSPKDLRIGLAETSHSRIGSPVDNILTYCYHYDPGTNKHSLMVARVVQMGGLVTLLSLGSFMFVMFRRDHTQALDQAHLAADKDKAGTKVNG